MLPLPRTNPPTNQIYWNGEIILAPFFLICKTNSRAMIVNCMDPYIALISVRIYVRFYLYVPLNLLIPTVAISWWEPASKSTTITKQNNTYIIYSCRYAHCIYIHIYLLHKIHYVCGWLYMHIIITKKCFLVRWKKK